MGIKLNRIGDIYRLHVGFFGRKISVNDVSLHGVIGKFCLEFVKRATSFTHLPQYIESLEFKNHKRYWERRGGDQYFGEQEAQESREKRSEFIADEIAKLKPSSVLEVGCGYGKQLKNIRRRLDCKLCGIDFSITQLTKAKELLSQDKNVNFYLANGSKLPFEDNSYELVFTSAVILHNKPEVADAIRKELIRVSKKWIVHNEDININYSRFGYDNRKIYEEMGYKIVKCEKIPVAEDPDITQFCVIDVESRREESDVTPSV